MEDYATAECATQENRRSSFSPNRVGYGYKGASANTSRSYNYPIATTREIEFHLIEIINRIVRLPFHPSIFFVFDELDKIEVPYNTSGDTQPEFSNEKYLPSGGTSRKRKTTVLHLLGNLKFFTSTAKSKFIFIAGREMYDAYLADLTDRNRPFQAFSMVSYTWKVSARMKRAKRT